jgi:eukaryotic-like serine/threonine-protein kinase
MNGSTVKAPASDGELALQTGSLVSAYTIESLVGAGGMGCVYRARHALTQRLVALKVMREEQLVLERSVDRMMREATILASVSHPGIPRLFECGLLDDGRPWIAMELVEGAALAGRMHGGGTLRPDEVLEMLGHVAEVLSAAHARGVTHRDLKPENVFLTPDDAAFPVRLIDWGIAHHLAGARYTSLNEAIGTPTYMSPEQARGGPSDGHCDVYGLGVVAYQALTGRAPFVGSSSVEILVQHLNKPVPPLGPRCPDAPYGLVELVERMLCKKFEDRPSARDVTSTVERLRGLAREVPDAVPLPIVEGERSAVTAQIRAPHDER